MNLAGQSTELNSNMLFVNFNQDCTSLAVGTKTGYRLYSLASVDKLETIFEHEGSDICVIDRLFASSLVAIVSLSSPRKLKVCHFKKGTEICSYSYSNTILAAKLNRQRLVVCLEESLYIHNIRDMRVVHTIRDTAPNPNGICAVSTSNEICYLAYPANTKIGEVQIFDADTMKNISMISAHDNPIAALAFNAAGNKITTASEKGTVIRVFSVPDGQKQFEFRRGVKRCATIHSLAFSPDSLFICCTSNTETAHVFRLENIREKTPDDSQGSWMGYFGAALKTSATYLPSQVSEMLNQGRDFATARLPFSGLKSVCAITCIQKMPRLLVAAEDGYLYVYNLDPVEGGECILLKQHRIDGHAEFGGAANLGVLCSDTTGGLLAGASAASGSPVVGAGARSSPVSYAASVRSPSETVAGSNSRHSDSPRSQPNYSDNESVTDHTMDNLRLDDDSEFPPVCHRIE